MRAWPAFLVVLLLLAPTASAQTEWVQLDDPPSEGPDGGADPADIVDLFYSANATHVLFREDLVALPDVSNWTYVVYIDKPLGGDYKQDYRLIYAESGAYMEHWNGTDWVYQEDIVVTVDGANVSVVFEVLVDSIGGVGDTHVKVSFENYQGADSFNDPEEKAPDKGGYKIHRRSIPNLPLIVLPIFVAGLSGTIFLLRRRILPT